MENNYAFKGVWIPKELWLSNELSTNEKILIAEIDALDGENGCFASNRHFADFLQLSEYRVSHIISSLRDRGFINVETITYNTGIVKRILSVNRPPTPPKNDDGCENSKGGCENSNYRNTYSNTISNTSSNIYCPFAKDVIDYLNLKTGSNYKHTTKATIKYINARYKEGFSLDDFKRVIDTKTKQWINDPKFKKFLRPETLFSTHFEGYLNEQETHTFQGLPDLKSNAPAKMLTPEEIEEENNKHYDF